MPDTDHRPLPARVAPPAAPLGSWRLLRAVLRNPIEAVPAVAYEEPLARQALFGRERVFVSDPELVERVLVAEADAFVKGEVTRRALGPALGDAILTAEASAGAGSGAPLRPPSATSACSASCPPCSPPPSAGATSGSRCRAARRSSSGAR
jgi:hypothetical protein